MANTREFLLTVVEKVLSNWTALNLAVEHGMGSRESAQEFVNYVTETLSMNDQLDSDDLAAEIEEYMDEVFHTELQDDSLTDVAKELSRFHQYCVGNHETLAIAELEKLPPTQAWIMARRPVPGNRNEQTEISEEPSTTVEGGEEEMEDDGWTTVKTRRG